ncbi:MULTISPECIES: hypothetical protein [Sorangium]|uniref:Uncharacterized protein n=1 Tax=Sorangium cellulosum TaxID=56 RepID=A0A4P2QT73_SORCE|nr:MULTISPECIES: hypothetical protein [Sorangium]AUX33164.1 uncharacterized protein SOCE836_053180 [Sorangium cellulosum]AUX33221.1 uncharacterized protein SOCE836_053750 [Sorangium cellulosum]WCQ92540.1 hypothetical protein NQZ70_05281 [Sorangium sp. Soce836]
MSGIDGVDRIEELAEWFRTLPGRTKGKGMELVAAAVQKVALNEYAQGKGPPGARGPWPARKKDGAVALLRPAGEVQFFGKAGAIRSTTAEEPTLDHHRGLRPVYPGAGKAKQMTPSWVEAAEKALREYLDELSRRAPK